MRTSYKNPTIHKAFRVLETLSADEETRLQAEIREKALRNALSELAAAREEGEKQGIDRGELIGEIRATQRFLQLPVSPINTLADKDMKELNSLLQSLEKQLMTYRSHG